MFRRKLYKCTLICIKNTKISFPIDVSSKKKKEEFFEMFGFNRSLALRSVAERVVVAQEDKLPLFCVKILTCLF